MKSVSQRSESKALGLGESVKALLAFDVADLNDLDALAEIIPNTVAKINPNKKIENAILRSSLKFCNHFWFPTLTMAATLSPIATINVIEPKFNAI